MSDPLVHYDFETGLTTVPGMYCQFDDDANTKVAVSEGTGAKLRRYYVTSQQLIDAGLEPGRYYPTFRLGDIDNTQVTDTIRASFNLLWSGQREIDQVGGGTLSARIGVASLSPDQYLDVVQGEQKTITFIVEARGRFVSAVADEIIVKISDSVNETLVVDESGGAIVRVCQELDVQVFRCTLSTVETAQLVEGLMKVEIAFDDQKVRMTHALRIIEQLEEQGS